MHKPLVALGRLTATSLEAEARACGPTLPFFLLDSWIEAEAYAVARRVRQEARHEVRRCEEGAKKPVASAKKPATKSAAAKAPAKSAVRRLRLRPPRSKGRRQARRRAQESHRRHQDRQKSQARFLHARHQGTHRAVHTLRACAAVADHGQRVHRVARDERGDGGAVKGESGYIPYAPELEHNGFVIHACIDTASKISTNDWKGKKVILFSVPGAFTVRFPHSHAEIALIGRCSRRATRITSRRTSRSMQSSRRRVCVDVIAVVAANDLFVMSGWARFEGCKDKILALSDTYAKWSESLGLSVDLTERSLGLRTARYAMIIDDLVVKYNENQMTIVESLNANFEAQCFDVVGLDSAAGNQVSYTRGLRERALGRRARLEQQGPRVGRIAVRSRLVCGQGVSTPTPNLRRHINTTFAHALDALPRATQAQPENASPSAASTVQHAAGPKQTKVRLPPGVVLDVTPAPDPKRWLKRASGPTSGRSADRVARAGAVRRRGGTGAVGGVPWDFWQKPQYLTLGDLHMGGMLPDLLQYEYVSCNQCLDNAGTPSGPELTTLSEIERNAKNRKIRAEYIWYTIARRKKGGRRQQFVLDTRVLHWILEELHFGIFYTYTTGEGRATEIKKR
ncbi:Redoxin-domain-containing protein [Mycena belliarum]|uniref:Redoxin-domain-containing protein n=1 Tax=Mycena belliarum TaxID=1033014 RepID=A0AAD6XHE2_9AGAR|nr:Redoxin-domain-containing protein [Mycena belliae]